jgi:hypothetical protein
MIGIKVAIVFGVDVQDESNALCVLWAAISALRNHIAAFGRARVDLDIRIWSLGFVESVRRRAPYGARGVTCMISTVVVVDELRVWDLDVELHHVSIRNVDRLRKNILSCIRCASAV